MAFIRRYDRTKPVKKEDPINENIRFKEVLVIDQNGEQLGVMSKRDAMNRAYDAGLDLVCVAPKAKPAVCRIMDYGKYRFEQQKKQKEMKKNSKVVAIKETQLSPTIDVHDKNVKLKRTLKWLQDGDKVVSEEDRWLMLILDRRLWMILLRNVLNIASLKSQLN